MNMFFIICAMLLHVSWCYGYPGPAPNGVGSFAYQDSTGNRYGGTYGLDGKQTVPINDPYAGSLLTSFADISSFFPNYITNYDNLLQEIFASDIEAQRLASYAAHKAYAITTNQIRHFPNFFRFPTFGPPSFFGGAFDMSQPNSAFASAVAGPGYTRQIAAISPENELIKNVDVTNHFQEPTGNNKFYSVSSSSFSSTANNNGHLENQRGSDTVVNNNGKVTKYRVRS